MQGYNDPLLRINCTRTMSFALAHLCVQLVREQRREGMVAARPQVVHSLTPRSVSQTEDNYVRAYVYMQRSQLPGTAITQALGTPHPPASAHIYPDVLA